VIWKSDSTSRRKASKPSSAVDLVDQEHGRPFAAGDRAEQGALEQVFAPEDQIFEFARVAGFALGDLEAQELALVVPLVERGVGVQALVALQPDQFRRE
jgi:hypothetical protein